MNIEELNTQLDYLKETKRLIKQQLIDKGQPIDNDTPFREYVDNMIDLIDTTDADAIDSDIIENKTAYVNGQKVTGTLEIVDAISIDNSDNTDTNLMLMNIGNIPSIVVGADINDLYGVKEVVEDGVGLEIIAPQSQFADVIGLTTDKIKQDETILGVVGSVVELNGDTETVTPTTSQQVITPTSPKNGFTQVTVNAVTSAIDSNIKTENIKSGVTILGVSGKSSVVDTSDASKVDTSTAVIYGNASLNLYDGNGIKISIPKADKISSGINETFTTVGVTPSQNQLYMSKTFYGIKSVLVESNSGVSYIAKAAYSDVANAIGLTAAKIKQGETILGITGTYAGSTMKEYASVVDMNNDIANIEAEEVVKVANISMPLPDYYIKSYNSSTSVYEMVKLVKESETISPQDFEEAEDQIGDLFGEGENN